MNYLGILMIAYYNPSLSFSKSIPTQLITPFDCCVYFDGAPHCWSPHHWTEPLTEVLLTEALSTDMKFLTVDLRIYCGVTSHEGYITGPAHQRRLRCSL